MDIVIQTITDWPIIVQGALGSALFWVILVFGQKIAAYLSTKIAVFSKETRKKNLDVEWLKYSGLKAIRDDDLTTGNHRLSSLIYIFMRPFTTGLIWICLGLLFQSVISVLGVVGFVGGVYYLFRALNIVKGIDVSIDIDQRLEKLERQLKELET